MTSQSSNRPISPLRARMIEDMSVRGFSEKTHSDYIRSVRALAAFIGRSPDTATAGFAPLPTSPDTDGHAAAEHQQRGLSLAFLLHRNARPAGPCTAAHDCAAAASAAGGAERGGDITFAPGGAGAQVQSGIRCRLRRWAARVRGGRA